jgi:hypothetical protein
LKTVVRVVPAPGTGSDRLIFVTVRPPTRLAFWAVVAEFAVLAVFAEVALFA